MRLSGNPNVLTLLGIQIQRMNDLILLIFKITVSSIIPPYPKLACIDSADHLKYPNGEDYT